MASRYTEPLTRILNAYPMGPGMLLALETYVKTVVESATARAEDELSRAVCEGLCSSPRGLKCLACYNAEANVPQMLQLDAEREIAERKPKG